METRRPENIYDVVLNFRGPDTRRGFLSHLVDALERANTVFFVDTQMHGSEYIISEQLSRAIESSRGSLKGL